MNETQSKKDKPINMLKTFLIAIGILGGIGLLLLLSYFTDMAENKANDVFRSKATAVTAERLIKDFDENELAADQNYQWVEVTGTVTKIGSSIGGSPYIILDDDVQCVLVSASIATDVRKGDTVTMTGEVSGKTLGNILIDKCK